MLRSVVITEGGGRHEDELAAAEGETDQKAAPTEAVPAEAVPAEADKAEEAVDKEDEAKMDKLLGLVEDELNDAIRAENGAAQGGDV